MTAYREGNLLNMVRFRDQSAKSKGFSLFELVVTLAIGLILVTISVPLITRNMGYFRLRSAASSVAGAIQSGRNQAISQGCPYQLVFTAASVSFQVQNEPPDPTTNACATAFANACTGGATACPVPFSGPGSGVTLNADTTLTFRPGGSTTSTTAVAGVTTLVLTSDNRTANINVSAFGNVNVQYLP
jgi:prepilin-type N-terminal cleavage/methylation domain-containing protein